MFSDPQFWVFVAFIIFIAAIFVPLKKIIVLNLDNKIDEIKSSIDQSEKIKNEAQKSLSEIKQRQNEVTKEMDAIKNNANEKITYINKQFEQKLKEQIKKRNELTKAKIEQMTREASNQVQQHIVQSAIKSTITILEKKLNQSEKQKLINKSIEELNSITKH